MELTDYKKLLMEDSDLVDFILSKDNESTWFYEKFLYFHNCVGDGCKYADSCVKLMKEDIDEFYSGRATNNDKQ